MRSKMLLDRRHKGIHGEQKNVSVGNSITIGCRIFTEGTGVIKVGDNCELEECAFLAEDGANIEIGDNCLLRGLW